MIWGQYADNATGFAIEYEFENNNIVSYRDERNENALVQGKLFPVLYNNERLDTTDYANLICNPESLNCMAHFHRQGHLL